MRFLSFIVILFLVSFPAKSQKVSMQVIKYRNVARSGWQVLDEQKQVVFSNDFFPGSDSITFSLDANERYFFKVSVNEVYGQDTSLYSLSINEEPVMLVNSGLVPGDHLYPFFTGIRTKEVKITGGTTTLISDFPWQVYYIAGNYRCGGSIISGRWVVTAAHCTLNDNGNPIAVSDMAIKVGTNNPSSPTDGKKYLVSEVIVHEGYDSQTNENDIALLRIKDSINYPNAIPIKLLSTVDAAAGAADPGVMSWVTGWGLTKVNPDVLPTSLQKVQLPIVSNAVAAAVWGTIPVTDIMAGYRNGNKDACSGDSGGPLVVPVLGEYKLTGIVSWGSANCNNYGAYTRVSLFNTWITGKTGIPALFIPPSPVGDSIVCQGTESSQYSIANLSSATAYEWRLYPADAGVITGNSTNASVMWDISKTHTVAVMVRVTIDNVLSDWSKLTVNIVRNTRLLSQSKDTTICAMQPLNIFASTEGYNLLYKWYQNNTLVQSGTSSQLVFSNALTNNSGIYKCEISGSCGTLLSGNINITVYPLTGITYISPDVEVPFGYNRTIEVTADGHNLTYQWEKDGTDIANANNNQLVLHQVNATDIGLYQAIVKGTCGTQVSDTVYVYTNRDNNPGSTGVFLWPTVTIRLFNVALSDNSSYNIQMFSITGRLIREQTNCHYQTVIDISALPRGVYVVNISNNNFRKSIKMIKS